MNGLKLCAVVALTAALGGCHLAAPTISGLFAPDEEGLQKSVAREYGLQPSDVTVTNREVDGHTVYFTANIKGKVRNCYITTSVGTNSSPLCAEPGKPISSGGNALTDRARNK